jgi:hypothetical protein
MTATQNIFLEPADERIPVLIRRLESRDAPKILNGTNIPSRDHLPWNFESCDKTR